MSTRIRTSMLTALALLAVAAGAQAVSPAMKELENDFVALADQIRPIVVNIDTEGTAGDDEQRVEGFEDLFRFFNMPMPERPGPGMPQMPRRMRVAQGSGFIFDKQGHIITNNHMVEDAERISVKLWNGNEYEAKVVGRDPDTDLAVIKIEATEDLPAAVLADSDALRVGQFAIAVGSPRGFEGSFSFGHISALGREHLNLPGLRFQNFIQTDAAINLGNSGGPLCNSNGEVVGINVAIVYGANSLGFAIPINTAKTIVPTLISEGKITRGFLGVGITDVGEYAEGVQLPDKQGAFVKTVQEGSPAAQAGIQPYDVIRKVNGQAVTDASNLVRQISAIAPGADTQLEVWRQGQAIQVSVKLTEYNGAQEPASENGQSFHGIHVQNLSADMAERLRLQPGTTGVLITGVDDNSPAANARLQTGDVITEIAQRKVNNTAEFSQVMSEVAQPGKSILIGFLRGGAEHDITVMKIPRQ